MAGSVLFIAAEGRELAGLVRRTGAKKLNWPVDFAYAADWGSARLLMLANGPGPNLAAQAVDVAFMAESIDAVVSTGMCGALAPDLKLLDIVVADRVVDSARFVEFPASAPTSRQEFRTGTVISEDRVAVTALDKRSLRDRGGDAVEMEAAGVARRASERGARFFCVRIVSDTADEGLVLDFNACRDSEGRFSRSRIVASALQRPLSGIPALMRLHQNSRAAAEALGEFLVDCQF